MGMVLGKAAQLPGQNEVAVIIDRIAKVLAAPVPSADLHHPVVLAGRVTNQVALGRGDVNAIDVLVVQQPPELFRSQTTGGFRRA